jgi:rhodanese-related sulfurtransferase
VAYRELLPGEALARYAEGEMVILDVRTVPEWLGGHIPGSVHIPMDELSARYGELDPDAETLVVCAHGIRSAAVGQWLAQIGFERVANLRHGLSRWEGPLEVGSG